MDWFDPRNGGALKKGSVTTVKGGAPAALGMPPDNPGEDWLAVVRRTLTNGPTEAGHDLVEVPSISK